jgi:hypothetical protein
VDTNLGEINNLGRSSLRRVSKDIKRTINDIREERKLSDKQKLTVAGAFYNLHRAEGKSEKHKIKLMNMMLKLYRGIYYGDNNLEDIFINRALYDIRHDEEFKYFRSYETSYILLKRIAKEKKVTLTTEEKEGGLKSVELGKNVARICWPLHYVINPFTKSRIGLINLNISGLEPLQWVEDFGVKCISSVLLHEGEEAGNKKVSLDGVAVKEFNDLTEEFRAKNFKFNKTLFIKGLLAEYSRQLYFSKSSTKEQ